MGWRAGNGRHSWRLRRLSRRVRGAALGTGVLALALPLAWPAGAGGQHLNVPSASQIRSGVVQLADFVSGNSSPAPSVPVQQSGTAAGQKHLVRASQTRGLKHASGHAPGKGTGQLPPWRAPSPSNAKSGTFTARGPVRGFNAATSTLDQSGTNAESSLYKNADGSFTRKLWPGPVNYKTASGTWKPIDQTLVRGSGKRWQEKGNSLGVSFAAAGGGRSLAAVSNPGGSAVVSFSLAGARNVTGVTSGASVTYPGILPGTDVTETAAPDGLSESLTLASPAAGTSWVFPLTLKGLTASITDGTVNLTNSAGTVVAVIPPAIARSGPVNLAIPDSQASSQLTYHLVTVNGGPALEMTLDKSWLDAPGRVFPVIVDPTVKEDPQGSSYVESQNGTAQTAANYTSTRLPTGTVTQSGTTYDDISFLDFSEFGSNLKADHVTSATLSLFDIWAYQCTYSEDMYAYRVTGSWKLHQSLTYPGPAYGTKLAQWTGVASSKACTNTSGLRGQGAWIHMPFNSSGLSLLNDWTGGTTTANFGFAIAPSMTDEQMFKQFDSYQDGNVSTSQGGDCDGDCRPYLSVTYTPDVPPQVDSQYPPNNYNSTTLTPELIASGSDPDNWPSALTYKFSVYDSAGNAVVNSGSTPVSDDWTVPAGSLAWGKTYYWTVQAYDGVEYSPTPLKISYFSTSVPQPLITSQLSQNTSGAGFDPGVGNWTTSATDAHVATVGPALEITRDYNSADPRLSGAFGAGWSSVLDMKVSPGQKGSGTTDTEVVTYPDGQNVAFGLNADGKTYSPPPGRYAELRTTSGGFTLTDKNDTIYTFTQSLSSGAYGITSITDAAGRVESFTWNGSDQITKITAASGRTLSFTWAAPSGAAYSHVTSVVTDDATAGDASTAQHWTYDYSGDDLTAACPPASTSACTAYTYTSGTDYPNAVLDSGPRSYWRLDETSGSTAASSVLANEGTDVATYSGVTLGQDSGPLAGAQTTAASFNGSSSHVQLPGDLVTAASYQSISLWFKTTTPDGVLFSSSSGALSATTSGSYSPELYVGSDGKLLGAFWDGNAADVISTSSAVDDGQWHNAVLADSAGGQVLYLDGVKVGQLSKGFASHVQSVNYVGAGFLGGGWPDESHYDPGVHTGYATYFTGDIADVALWGRQLTGPEAQAMYAAGASPAALATKVTRPSGKVKGQVTYDSGTGRAVTVTDANGGTWHISGQAVAGSSQVYVASVLGAEPVDYWRLDHSGVTDAVNEVNGGTAVFSSVTEGVSGGPFTDATVDSFNGSSSYLTLPSGLVGAGNQSVSLWFKTTTPGGVLLGTSTGPLQASTTGNYVPQLYVGSDGKLLGAYWDGHSTYEVSTSSAVDDGKWHNAVLAGSADGEVLYLDGAKVGQLSEANAAHVLSVNYVGAGFIGGKWPDETHYSTSSNTGYAEYFKGDIAEVASYDSQLTSAQVTAEYKAAQHSPGLAPVATVTVTDPGGHDLSYAYDMLNGNRMLSQVNAEGGKTSYGYDSGGFRDQVTDPDGNVTTTGYDVRGNVVSRTTCQDQANNKCSTSYYTYYPDDTTVDPSPDPRNDMVTSYSDGRSASSTDTTYQTKYSYDAAGDLTAVTTPPVSGFSSGQVTKYAYTNGTSSDGGYQGAVPPAGLPYQKTTPGGAVTETEFYADGNIAQVTTPDGQRSVYTYDGLGREISQTAYSSTYPNGLTTTYAYDANGRLVTQTDPAVTDRVTGATHTRQVTTSYDADGDVTSQTVADLTGGDASRTTTRTYNSYDELASVTDPAGAKTSYTYDGYGNKASQADPNGNVTDYAYDGDGHLLTSTLENYTGSPPGSQSAAPLVEESRAYDPAGRLASVTDAMGFVTSYGYTDNGLVSSVTRSDPATSASYTEQSSTYDAAGNLTARVTDNGGTTTDYTVNADDQQTSQVLDPSGLDRVTSYAYTPDGSVLTTAVSNGATAVADGQPSGTVKVTGYSYDGTGSVAARFSYGDSDPSLAPSAWFPLDDGAAAGAGFSPATAADVSGNGNTGVVPSSGVTWPGYGAGFSGSSSAPAIVTAGPVVDTAKSFTVSAWVDITGDASATQGIVAEHSAQEDGFRLDYSGGVWQFSRVGSDAAGAPSSWDVASASGAVTGSWAHLTGTFDASSGAMTLYVDGQAAGTATDTTPFSATGPLAIGNLEYEGGYGNPLDGQVGSVQVYPYAMSAAQVAQVYGQGKYGTPLGMQGTATTWSLGERGLPTSMTDPDGNTTTYSYDEAGRLAVTTGPATATEAYDPGTSTDTTVTAHPVTTTGYDTFGDTAETQGADGNVTTYGYDGDGRRVSTVMPDYTAPDGSGAYTQAAGTPAVAVGAYDGDGLVTSLTSPLGNVTRYAYDQLGNRVSVTAPDGAVTATAYDALGQPLSVTGPTGAVSESTYDFLGRRVTSTRVERYPSSAAYTTTYSYKAGSSDPGGTWVSSSLTAAGVSAGYGYDAAGEETWAANGAGDTTDYWYDALGRRTTVVNPDGTVTALSYDTAGNVTRQSSLNSSWQTVAQTSATYNGDGQETSSTDAAGNTTTFSYNPAGQVTQEVQPVTASSSITTSFGYDAAGNRTRYTDGNGSNWYYTYNSWGLPESRVEPATSQYSSAADSTFTTSYDAGGNPVSLSEPGGVTLTGTYNSVGELTGQGGSGADAATASRSFGYDLAGNLTSASTSAAGNSAATSESFTYDDRGLVLSASGTAGSTSYGYNGDGQVASVDDAAGTTAYTYDSTGRLATLADPLTGTTLSYSYTPDSQVSAVTYGSGGDTQALAYDSQHRLTSDTLKTAGGTTVASVSYGYNADGLVTSQDTTGLAGPASSAYTYDEAGRLTSWDNGTTTTAYAWDANGNLTQKGATAYTYDARDELTSDGTGSYAYTARGTASSESSPSGTIAVAFDAYGQQATAGTSSYTYDALGRLTADAPSSGTGYQFSYAGPTGAIASDGSSAYSWGPSGGTLVASGAPGGGSGALALVNAHGDVIGQFSAGASSLSGSRAYDPWGAVTASTGVVTGDLGYQSSWSDPGSGKDLMGARWYAPGAGSFTSADTIPQSPLPVSGAGNPFAYVAGNPLENMDPTGHGIGLSILEDLGEIADPEVGVAIAIASVAAPAVKANAHRDLALYGTLFYATYQAGKAELHHLWSSSGSAAHTSVKPHAHATTHGVEWPFIRSGLSLPPPPPTSTTPRHHPAGNSTVPYQPQTVTVVDGSGGGGVTDLSSGPVYVPKPAKATPAGVGFVPSANQGLFTSASGLAHVPAAIRALVASGAAASAAAAMPPGSNGNGGCPPDPSALINLVPSPGQGNGNGSANQSFTASTRVLLPGGKTVAISHLRPGEKVLARDTRTGKDQPEKVTAVLLRHDTDLYDLKVKTKTGTEVIHTTSNHPIWDTTLHRWVTAGKLKKGDHLQTPDGTPAVADGGTTPKVHDGNMWDLTVPGNNDHDFYVLPAKTSGSHHAYHMVDGNTPVLVHNVNLCQLNSEPTKPSTHFADVTVHDANGNIVDEYSLRSGAQTPAEKAMGPRGAEVLSHTENRVARMSGGVPTYGNKVVYGDEFFNESPVPQDGYVVINGINKPCSNCMGAMTRAAQDTGSTFVYMWPGEEEGTMNWWQTSG